ncbi:cAMP-dependent protein kinase regulatory subunit, dimerization-anchoring domain [Cinara cedri]|uniref:cAMP-dependent protein kinase regulatory subunit, dimerization-anchoring domain n=1 Tax=Cinara cedri TaxID=506608 RepID=A0A5E4NK54_9HEMI|nr:cAMP-dependent protein kinase regulatory subunit, dimerization-anchoring domain [Cinara cedri]
MSATASKCYGVESVSNFSSTIEVPGYFPKMLTEWSKCALRTQPSELIRWSAIYFDMKSNGEHPPIKPYLDPPGQILGPGGLTINALKSLAMTLSNEFETYEKIEQIWDILSLDKDVLLEIVKIGKFEQLNNIKPNEFIGFATAYLNDRLRNTMIMLCDILSKDNLKGIILDDFVTVYRYLARLNCTEALSSNKSDIVFYDKMNIEENDSQYFKYTDSHSSSLKDECSYGSGNEGTNLLDSLSMEGITIWQNDNDELKSLTDMLNIHEIIPPTVNTNICGDFLSPTKTLKEYLNNEDLLSLLSVSSIISKPDSSEISLDASPNDMKLIDENTIAEEYNYNEETMTSGRTSSVLNDLDSDEKDTRSAQNDTDEIINDDVINESNTIQDITSEGNIEISTVVKYEDTINDMDNETYEDDNTNNTIKKMEINTDFIVMLALVEGKNNNNSGQKITTENNEHNLEEDNESTKSEFSLLNRTELNDTTNIEQGNDDEIVFNQTFNENVYINTGIESTDASETSDSDEFQYSEIDQQSQHSMTSIMSRKSSVQTSNITDIVLTTIDKNIDELLVNNELSISADEFGLTDATVEETEHCSYDKNEDELKFSYISSVESIKNKCEETESFRTEEHVRVLAGIGPAIPEKQIQLVVDWVAKCASNQNNYVQEQNLLHFLCPPLDHILMDSDDICI